MDQKETLALWKKGKKGWNKWAEGQLEAKETLVINEEWATSQNEVGIIQPLNYKTLKWMKDSTAFFSTEQNPFKLPTEFKFDEWIFPHRVIFSYSVFEDSVSFNGTTFLGNATFHKAIFKDTAGFNSTIFSGNGLFVRTRFEQQANFIAARFERVADFGFANFADDASFSTSHFKGAATFKNVRVHGNTWFGGTRFDARAIFDFSVFDGYTSFQACNIEHAFSLKEVEFSDVPDFSQAHCREAPLLDFIRLSEDHSPHGFLTICSQLWGTIVSRVSVNKIEKPLLEDSNLVKVTNLALRYRSLKRMAIQGHDHKNEIMFFAEELNANRKHDCSLMSPEWLISSTFLALSNYGRSILRPILWWLPITYLSALSYLSSATSSNTPKGLIDSLCYSLVPFYHWLQGNIPTRFRISWLPETDEFIGITCKGGSALSAAFQLSSSKGLIIPGLADKTLITQAYDCLYNGNVPFGISWTMGLQTLASAALLFLLLLGIRNRLKLK